MNRVSRIENRQQRQGLKDGCDRWSRPVVPFGLWLLLWIAALVTRLPAQTGGSPPAAAALAPVTLPGADPDLRIGRVLLQAKQFAAAKRFFETYLRQHAGDSRGDPQAQLGLGDAQLGLHAYEAAETAYRTAVRQQPELWQAQKNLVIVEAALGRWEEFEGERTVLRLARKRGAPGLSTRESDVIDSFDFGPGHWVVRAYFEPVGRSLTVYNFERFSPAGRVVAYVSLENAAAAQGALRPSDVRIGNPESPENPKNLESPEGSPAPPPAQGLALNWYTGSAHGTIRNFPEGDPGYRQLRAVVLRWLRTHPAPKPTGRE